MLWHEILWLGFFPESAPTYGHGFEVKTILIFFQIRVGIRDRGHGIGDRGHGTGDRGHGIRDRGHGIEIADMV
jgi:hypothetical protein